MSTKSTIFLTKDNEHCYEECSEPLKDNEGKRHDAIYLELAKWNIEVIADTEQDLVIAFTDPDSEIFKIIKSLTGKNIKDIAVSYLKDCIKDEENDAEECIQERDNEEAADECFDRIKEYQKVLDLIKEK